jgi:ADP-heptose:LPS heptosyltransferase
MFARLKKCIKNVLSFPTSPQCIFFIGKRFNRRHNNHSEINFSEINNILVIRLDAIGDVILTSPFFRELRQNFPRSWIALVVQPSVMNLVELCPYVDQVLSFDWRGPRFVAPYVRHWRAWTLARRRLRPRRFDLALLPRWDADSFHGTILAYLSGSTRRVGYSEKVNASKAEVNHGNDLLLTQAINDPDISHEVQYNLNLLRHLRLAAAAGPLELWPGPEDRAFAETIWQNHGVSNSSDIVIALGPGAGAPPRRWPASRFAELAARLRETSPRRLLVLGGPGEEDLGDSIFRQLGDSVINLAGRTTLRQAGALLQRCHLFVGNDSGLLHLAAAAGLPVVQISALPENGPRHHPSSPARFGPWGVPHRVLQPYKALPPCSDSCSLPEAHCILGVTVERVRTAVEELLRFEPDKNISTLRLSELR